MRKVKGFVGLIISILLLTSVCVGCGAQESSRIEQLEDTYPEVDLSFVNSGGVIKNFTFSDLITYEPELGKFECMDYNPTTGETCLAYNIEVQEEMGDAGLVKTWYRFGEIMGDNLEMGSYVEDSERQVIVRKYFITNLTGDGYVGDVQSELYLAMPGKYYDTLGGVDDHFYTVTTHDSVYKNCIMYYLEGDAGEYTIKFLAPNVGVVVDMYINTIGTIGYLMATSL